MESQEMSENLPDKNQNWKMQPRLEDVWIRDGIRFLMMYINSDGQFP